MKLKTTLTTLAAAVLIGVGLTAPASAVSQVTGPASCSTEIRVASQTTGTTHHRTSAGQYWNKGYKNNAGATSYTGYASLTFVQTDVVSSPEKIASSGYACK